MTRSQLEHLIRAAGTIANDNDLIVIGSQAILGGHPDAPEDLLISREADLYPRNYPERADLIDGSIGEGSPFDRAFGYHAHGVGPETATLPEGWQDRLIPIRNENTRGVCGWCLDLHDLAISKYVASRPKDRDYTIALARHRLTRRDVLLHRLELTRMDPAVRELILCRIRLEFAPHPA